MELNIPQDNIQSQAWPQLAIMVNVLNRYAGEINLPSMVERIAFHIVNEFKINKISPLLAGNCDMYKAAECFVAVCLKKMIPSVNEKADYWIDDKGRVHRVNYYEHKDITVDYDRFITYESRESLHMLTTFWPSDIESGLSIPKRSSVDIEVHPRQL